METITAIILLIFLNIISTDYFCRLVLRVLIMNKREKRLLNKYYVPYAYFQKNLTELTLNKLTFNYISVVK